MIFVKWPKLRAWHILRNRVRGLSDATFCYLLVEDRNALRTERRPNHGLFPGPAPVCKQCEREKSGAAKSKVRRS